MARQIKYVGGGLELFIPGVPRSADPFVPGLTDAEIEGLLESGLYVEVEDKAEAAPETPANPNPNPNPDPAVLKADVSNANTTLTQTVTASNPDLVPAPFVPKAFTGMGDTPSTPFLAAFGPMTRQD